MSEREKNPAAVALGSMTSAKKKVSSANNGKLGGRPRKNKFFIKDRDTGQIVMDPTRASMGTVSKGFDFESRAKCREWIAEHKAQGWAVVKVVPIPQP